ncbi:hypothetical protein JKP88DRAFT_263730 [Tribonema minus]|uniref:Uncharacterized protein n=1 Tax=Tribonema minus TaxID=303371 RepID=A0A835Z2G4_9STRA|nr:hypothetical protein JKP88DRAFT_263730 [Tribonema minus]
MARWARQWPSESAKRHHRAALARARNRVHAARLRANPDLLKRRRELHREAQRRCLARQRELLRAGSGNRSDGGPEPPTPREQRAGEEERAEATADGIPPVPDGVQQPPSPPAVPEPARPERVVREGDDVAAASPGGGALAGDEVPPPGDGGRSEEDGDAEPADGPAAAAAERWEDERGPSSPPPYLKDGYCPFRGLRASPPCARYYVDDPVYERLRLALERLVPGYELLAASSCSSDLLGLVHQWATCFGGETAGVCLDLASAGGRGLPGRTCAARPRVDREAEGLRPKEQVLRLLGGEGRKGGCGPASFVDAWRSGAVQTAFVEHVRRRLAEDSPKPTILLLETAPVYYDACLTGGTLRALASLCARQGVALVTDEVMLSVRCGRPLSSDYARSFRPDAAVLGSKALGSAFVVVRRQSPLKHAFRSQPMMVGQEISAAAAEAAVRAIDYILREDLMAYIAGEGEARRRAAGASGAGYLWHDAPREAASAFPAYARGTRVLLPLDYRFPPEGGEGAVPPFVADRSPPAPAAGERRATRSGSRSLVATPPAGSDDRVRDAVHGTRRADPEVEGSQAEGLRVQALAFADVSHGEQEPAAGGRELVLRSDRHPPTSRRARPSAVRRVRRTSGSDPPRAEGEGRDLEKWTAVRGDVEVCETSINGRGIEKPPNQVQAGGVVVASRKSQIVKGDRRPGPRVQLLG